EQSIHGFPVFVRFAAHREQFRLSRCGLPTKFVDERARRWTPTGAKVLSHLLSESRQRLTRLLPKLNNLKRVQIANPRYVDTTLALHNHESRLVIGAPLLQRKPRQANTRVREQD